jgi:hypothetical protein
VNEPRGKNNACTEKLSARDDDARDTLPVSIDHKGQDCPQERGAENDEYSSDMQRFGVFRKV